MLPSNKRWLPATSSSRSGAGAASSSTDPSAWVLSEPGSGVLSWGNEPQLCYCSLCRGWALLPPFNPPRCQGKPALQAHLGWAAPRWLPAAGNKAATKLHGIGASSFSWQRALCCPSSSTSSWQEPAPEYPGENEGASLVRAGVVPTDLFSQFDISMRGSTRCFSARRFRPTEL